jgi:hypothetical protein
MSIFIRNYELWNCTLSNRRKSVKVNTIDFWRKTVAHAVGCTHIATLRTAESMHCDHNNESLQLPSHTAVPVTNPVVLYVAIHRTLRLRAGTSASFSGGRSSHFGQETWYPLWRSRGIPHSHHEICATGPGHYPTYFYSEHFQIIAQVEYVN